MQACGYGLITDEITHKILFYAVCLLVGIAYVTTFIMQVRTHTTTCGVLWSPELTCVMDIMWLGLARR